MVSQFEGTPTASMAATDGHKFAKEIESGDRESMLKEVHTQLSQMSTEDRKSYLQYLNRDLGEDLKDGKLPALQLSTDMTDENHAGKDHLSLSNPDDPKADTYQADFDKTGALTRYEDVPPPPPPSEQDQKIIDFFKKWQQDHEHDSPVVHTTFPSHILSSPYFIEAAPSLSPIDNQPLRPDYQIPLSDLNSALNQPGKPNNEGLDTHRVYD